MIQTARLVLQSWTRNDLAALQQLFDDVEVRRYLFDNMPVSLERTESILEMHLALQEARGIGFWAVYLGVSMIGFAGVSGDDDEAELMYALLPAHWGHGYATEASEAVVAHAVAAGYSRIAARTDPPNGKSVRVLERLGFSRRGFESGPEGQPLVVYEMAANTIRSAG